MNHWTLNDMPSQAGKRAVITGATGGLGYETALAIAHAGGEVILAARNPDKGSDALAAIRAQVPDAPIRFEWLDLASLASVADFSQRLRTQGRPIDVLVNNAGVMAYPQRRETADGFEAQLGINYLGHYALTAQLLPLLRQAAAPRVVSLSSALHHVGAIHFEDLQMLQHYSPNKAYAQSKLAMLMFALELQRRSNANGWGLLSIGAHPGYARTDLIANGPGTSGLMAVVVGLLQPLISQSAAAGALPTLYAATSPDARGGGYYGPDRMLALKGSPTVARISKRARDVSTAARLWDISATLTGASFSID